MEIILLCLALAAFFVFIFVNEAFQEKKREKNFIASLYHDFGKQVPQKEYPLERYARMGSFFQRHRREGQIDEITWNDLSMDDLFKRMNYTFSASGEEYLYYTLHNTMKTKEELNHLEEVICFFTEHPDERVKIQFHMNRLGHTGKFSLYDYLDNLDFL